MSYKKGVMCGEVCLVCLFDIITLLRGKVRLAPRTWVLNLIEFVDIYTLSHLDVEGIWNGGKQTNISFKFC